MIETSPLLQWALIVFTIVTGSDGGESHTYAPPGFHATYLGCTAEGTRILSTVEPTPGVEVRFSCIPRAMLRDDLAMLNAPHD